jgi:hypothetical protein
MQFIIYNVTSGTSINIDPVFPIGGGATPSSNGWFFRTSPSLILPNRNVLYDLGAGMPVTKGDEIQIRMITPSWSGNPGPLMSVVTLFLE